MTSWPKRQVIGRRQIEREVRVDRPAVGPVDLAPHRPEECPRRWGDSSPCPFVSCRYHLWGEATPHGSIMVYHQGAEPWELEETCSDDVSRRGVQSLEDIAWYFGITVERVRYILGAAVTKLEDGPCDVFDDYWDEYESGARKGGHLETGKLSGVILRGERTCPPSHRGLTVMIMTESCTYELSEEQVLLKGQCSRMASRVFDLLLLYSEARGGLGVLARVYEKETGSSTRKANIKLALADLEKAGLIRCKWRARGKVTRLVTVEISISRGCDERGKTFPPSDSDDEAA